MKPSGPTAEKGNDRSAVPVTFIVSPRVPYPEITAVESTELIRGVREGAGVQGAL